MESELPRLYMAVGRGVDRELCICNHPGCPQRPHWWPARDTLAPPRPTSRRELIGIIAKMKLDRSIGGAPMIVEGAVEEWPTEITLVECSPYGPPT